MFKTRRATPIPEPRFTSGDNPWDQETFDQIERDGRIHLHVTHIERRFVMGSSPYDPAPQPHVISVVCGYLSQTRQLAHFEMSFEGQNVGAGSARCSWFDGVPFNDQELPHPLLKVFVGDPDGALVAAMHSALSDAIASGKTVADARLWPSFAPGWRDQSDQKMPQFEISGCYVWGVLAAPALAPWAMPAAEADLTTYPAPSILRRKNG